MANLSPIDKFEVNILKNVAKIANLRPNATFEPEH